MNNRTRREEAKIDGEAAGIRGDYKDRPDYSSVFASQEENDRRAIDRAEYFSARSVAKQKKEDEEE